VEFLSTGFLATPPGVSKNREKKEINLKKETSIYPLHGTQGAKEKLQYLKYPCRTSSHHYSCTMDECLLRNEECHEQVSLSCYSCLDKKDPDFEQYPVYHLLSADKKEMCVHSMTKGENEGKERY
jgi:hypothetical protein